MRRILPTLVLAVLIAAACSEAAPAESAATATAQPTAALTPTSAPTATPIPTPVATTEPTPAATAQPTATLTPTSGTSTTGTVVLPPVAEVGSGLPAYSRSEWKHWIDADGDCQDARQEVLVAESTAPVTFTTASECRVATGVWIAPFSGLTVNDPSDLDIDHMIPLKNAHESGAWAWDAAKKEAYANSLDDPDHLIAVTASANRSKGAKGPESWKPAEQSYWCEYAQDWIRIKITWELAVTQEEANALLAMLEECEGGIVVAPTTQPSPVPTPSAGATPIPVPQSNCDPSYPDVCIPPPPPDLDCGEISHRRFKVVPPDPHRFDRDNDGIGCEA